MKDYILKDSHGQPVQLFKPNFENNVSKAIDQLSGICSGILADGVVTQDEAKFFAEWIKKYASYEPIWPFTDILSRVRRIFADGECDEAECLELKSVMEALCGYTKDALPQETYSTELPLDIPLPDSIEFKERNFSITGRFAYGSRPMVLETITNLGGTPTDASPSSKTHYLIIGTFASRDWANTNYGRKIERAVELRSSGTGISIISEEHWRKFVA